MSETMKVMATDGYGPIERLALMSIPLPDPGKGEVRVRVHASALNPADYKVITGSFKFLHARNRPLVIGYDFSGVIDKIGPEVTAFKVGQNVFGFLPYGPGNKQGAFAEALIARVDSIAEKPASVSHQQAAAVATPGITCLQSMRDLGKLRKGQRVAITGASGGVGLLAVAIAKRLGASVTAIGSGRGLELARLAGAEQLVDRTSAAVPGSVQGTFDVVFDPAAAYRWAQWKPLINRKGHYVTTLPSLGFAVDKLASLFGSTGVHFVNVKGNKPSDLELLGRWLSDGLNVHVDHVVEVRDVAKSLVRLQKGGVVGRIVVEVLGKF
ncbi:MAG: NAD(P)-dependent alcohol dehydrogenase [Flavobacteriales bacterium]|nr:NAD(P)-dependent alcohol dehydrogenase [Flavobacteriales bacterium]